MDVIKNYILYGINDYPIDKNICARESSPKFASSFLFSLVLHGEGGIDGRGGVNKHILDYYLQNVYYLQNSKDIFPLSRKSTRRPGVATSRWQPLSKSLIWSATLAPPYTTQGLTYTNNFLLKNN